jgi:septin family protein
MMGNGAPNNFP